MLSVAFSVHDVLAPANGFGSHTALADVQEIIRPTAAAVRTLRELDGLGLALYLTGDIARPLLRRYAQVVWFPGEVIAANDPLAELEERTQLPASCVWFVTADPAEARRAADHGFQAVRIDTSAPPALGAPDANGIHVAGAVDDVLEMIRRPYTRAALHLRYLVRKLMDTPAVDELVR